jgi:hypothetical protein
MPDKIEWFVFPNGPKIRSSPKRPAVESNYFVLNAGDDTQWYGVGLTFYMKGFATEEIATRLSHSSLQFPYDANRPCESSAQEPCWIWMGVSLCILTKLPYLDSLTLVLNHTYFSSILPSLAQAEENALGFPSTPLSLDLEGVMSLLCLDSICPVPGILDVALRLPSHEDSLITFHGNSPQSWPYCPCDLTLSLRTIGVRTMVDLLYFVMAEKKIILHSSDTSRLSTVGESLRVMSYPLRWCSAYIPVVPALLLDLVDAPVPYILGISSALLSKINPTVFKSVVLVNCDTGTINTSLPINRYPDEIDRWCLMSLKSVINNPLLLDEVSQERGVEISASTLIQTILLDSFVSVFSWVPECIFNIGAGYPIFNSHMFLHGYCPGNAIAFAEAVIDTQAFQRIVSEIHLPRLSLFVNCCKRMKYGYGYCRFIDGVKNSSTEMYPIEDRRFGLDLEENLPLGELSNPRRLLRPPYRLVNSNKDERSTPLVPIWICESPSIVVEEAIKSIADRYLFSYHNDQREVVTHLLPADLVSNSQTSNHTQQASRNVAFPPLTFAVHSNPSHHKKKRKVWTFDDLEALWSSTGEPHEAQRIDALRERYRQFVLTQHKLTRELINISKKLHVEYMFGEDVIMRLILRILPLSTSDGIHDMDLAAALQQGSDSFSQGAARRSLVTILSEYC